MSRDPRKYYRGPDQDRNRPPIWGRSEYRSGNNPNSRRDLIKGSRSRSPPMRSCGDKSRRSRSPRKNEKDVLDENILSEISKLPEPSELWESNQYQENPNFAVAAAAAAASASVSSFPAEGSASLGYQTNYQPQYSGIYDDFPPLASAPQSSIPAPDMATWNQMSLPPPPAQFINLEDQMKKEAAIETEMRHQKAALSKQREDYMKKATILKKELDTLKDQRNELRGDSKRSPSPDTKRFLKENTKLQLEIQNKLKTINNVVDMLNGIIGEEAPELPDSDDSDHGSKRKSRSPSNKKFNYVYYDPEMHWCRVCNEFPPTAKDYLNHLHSPAHHKMAAAHMEAPWHSVSGINEGFPSFPSAPTKRTPIKGLQFFVPSTAWYCKLCDQFIGDLHCASAHLKSVTHSKNYTNFVELNPHWETDWMSDRQKAFEKARANNKVKVEEKPQYTAHTITFHKDGFHTKNKIEPASPEKEKKKKKDKKKKSKRKRSSSSSDSDSSSSESDTEKKRKKSKSNKDIPSEKVLTEWMSTIQRDRLNDSDRKLLDSLKSRMKSEKQEAKRRSTERQRSPDSRKGRESERRELSSRDRRDRKSRSRESRTRESPRASRTRESPRASRARESPRASRARESPRDSRDSRGKSRRREERAQSPPPADSKKPEIRKMPFIGKMPVYKHLGKKVEDQKKEELEQKKKEEDEANKKRREEMDAEIQKKVAEFKEKIAISQKERGQLLELPPPGIALPTHLGPALPAPPALQQPPPPAYLAPPPTSVASSAAPTLPKDFQEALDIIFPAEATKQELAQAQQDLFNMTAMPPFPMPLGFPPLPLMQPQMPQMSQMFGFDMNSPLFPPRPQLYDTHVPLVPSPKPRQQPPHKRRPPNNQTTKQTTQPTKQTTTQSTKPNTTQNTKQTQNAAQKTQADKENGAVVRKKEELDELAMLGIDASDVGANI